MDNIKEDISVLTQVRDSLKKEIDATNIRLSNINTALHEAEVRRESERKLDEVKDKTRESIKDENNIRKLDKLVEKEYSLRLREERLSDRESVLHRREQQVVDLDEVRKKLNEERGTFNNYKINILKELDKAREIIAESKVAMNKVLAKEDELKAREKALKKGYEDLKRGMGVLEQQKKDWEIAKNGELLSISH